MNIERKPRQALSKKALPERNTPVNLAPTETSKSVRIALNSAAMMVAGAFLIAPDYSYAATKHTTKTKKSASGPSDASILADEVARLRQELANSKRENAQLKSAIDNANAQGGAAPQAEATEATPAEAVAAAPAQKAEETFSSEAPKALGEVVVNSRRKEEKLQDVPLPVSVVGSEITKRDNIVSVAEITQKVPNVLFTASNSRQTSIAIRGLGKNASDEARDPSVGVQVDNVPIIWPGAAYTNFVDLDHIEFLRGPQGTLQGKNANLGLLNIVTKLPSWKPEYYMEGFGGSRGALQGKASASGPILDGLLAYRATFYIDRRDGFVDNKDGPVTIGNLKEVDRLGGRLQLLFTPTEKLSARIIVDRASATNTQIADYAVADPAKFLDGSNRTSWSSRLSRDWFNVNGQKFQPIFGDARKVQFDDIRPSRGDQQGVSSEINYDLPLHKLTSISAYRYGLFEPHNDGDRSPYAISEIAGGTVEARQWSQEFRLTSKKPAFGFMDYQVGALGLRTNNDVLSQTAYGADAGAFYASDAQYSRLNKSAVGRVLLRDSMNGIITYNTFNPTVTSLSAFGQTDLHLTDKATLTLGLRHTWEDRSNKIEKWYTTTIPTSALTQANYPGATAQDINDAIAIRGNGSSGGVLGNQYGAIPRQGFDEHSENWLVNPSYKFTKDVMGYFSISGGEKAGAALFDANGKAENAKPEQVLDFELGVKTAWFNRKLFVNLNLYDTIVKDYQARLLAIDPTQTSGYRTTTGNVGEIEMRGVELETSATPYQGLNVFLNGSFNNAVYTDFANAPCPPENNSSKPCDFTGKTIPNAPLFTANFGADYRRPLGFLNLEGIVFLTDSYRTAANYNPDLSIYGKQEAYHITDGGIGVATLNGKYNLSLIARNLFDTRYITNSGSISATSNSSAVQGDARYFGVNFRTNF